MATKKKPTAKKAPPVKKRSPVKPRVPAPKNEPRFVLPELKPLNPQQQLFVTEYLKDRNATKAAIRAGYSEKTAAQIGYQLLQNPSVRAAIDAGLEKLLTDNGLTAQRVLKEMARLAFFDPLALYHPDGRFKAVHELDPDIRACIAKVEITGTKTSKEGQTARIELVNKPQALRMAAQHFGLLKEHVEITGKNGGPIETRELSDAERAVRLANLLARAAARAKGQGK